MRVKNIVVLAGLCNFVLMLGCSRNSADAYVGVTLPLSGYQSQYGEEVKNSLLIATEDEFNQSGTRIELLIEDNKDAPASGISALNKILSQCNPLAIINGGSSVAMALAPKADKLNIPMIGVLASDEQLSALAQKSYRAYLSSKVQARALADFAIDTMSITNCAMLVVNNDHGITSATFFKDRFVEKGGTVVAKEFYDINAVDLKSLAYKILSRAPQSIYVFGYGIGYTSVIDQMYEQGFTGCLITMDTMSLRSVRAALHPKGEIVFTASTFDDRDNLKARMFEERYFERYGLYPSHAGASAYETIRFIAKSVRKKGESVQMLIETLGNDDIDGMLGDVRFGPDRNMKIPVGIYRYDGKILRRCL